MKKPMVFTTVLSLVCCLALAGCKKSEAAGEGEKTEAAEKSGGGDDTSTGVPECDAYLKAFEALTKCDKAGPALGGLKQGLESSKQAWSSWKSLDDTSRKAAQQAAGPGCKAGEDAIKQTATSLGCSI